MTGMPPPAGLDTSLQPGALFTDPAVPVRDRPECAAERKMHQSPIAGRGGPGHAPERGLDGGPQALSGRTKKNRRNGDPAACTQEETIAPAPDR